jgi:hypothetical protein
MPNSRTRRFCATALLGILLSTSAVPAIAQSLDDLAARGEILAAADPLAGELRDRLDEAGQRGFDIGMGGTEGQTLMGPGKQARGDALPAEQQAGYFAAVLYSVTRNANLEALLTGGRVAQGNRALTDARRTEDDPFYTLGFDIATGLLHNLNGGLGDVAQSLGAGNVRDTLSGAAQRGFDNSARLQGRNYVSKAGGSTAILTSPGGSEVSDGTADVDRVGQVPDVVGLAAADAAAALTKAGYKFTEVTIKGNDPRPPFDVVQGTVPPAGTGLVAGSDVRYQLVDAAILNGTGFLDVKDVDYRIAFDLETGKYAELNNGGDVFMNRAKAICIIEATRGGGREKCFDPQPLLEAANGARVVVLSEKYIHFRLSESPALKSRQWFLACSKAFSGEPLKTEIYAGNFSTACVRTAEGHLSVVRFEPRSPNGNFHFEYALFPDYPVVKAQGRVKLGGEPSAISKLSICEKAKVARDRNSPAAPGLARKCIEGGGTVPQ